MSPCTSDLEETSYCTASECHCSSYHTVSECTCVTSMSDLKDQHTTDSSGQVTPVNELEMMIDVSQENLFSKSFKLFKHHLLHRVLACASDFFSCSLNTFKLQSNL